MQRNHPDPGDHTFWRGVRRNHHLAGLRFTAPFGTLYAWLCQRQPQALRLRAWDEIATARDIAATVRTVPGDLRHAS